MLTRRKGPSSQSPGQLHIHRGIVQAVSDKLLVFLLVETRGWLLPVVASQVQIVAETNYHPVHRARETRIVPASGDCERGPARGVLGRCTRASIAWLLVISRLRLSTCYYAIYNAGN